MVCNLDSTNVPFQEVLWSGARAQDFRPGCHGFETRRGRDTLAIFTFHNASQILVWNTESVIEHDKSNLKELLSQPF